jgi:hypothetical protein
MRAASLPTRTASLVVALALVAGGCASLAPQRVAVDISRPELQSFGTVRGLTQLERDARLDTTSNEAKREPTVPVFWSGIAVGTLGTIGVTGFGIAGNVAKNRLNDVYADGGATVDERDRQRNRGELWNTLAITSAALMVVGFAAAAISYTIDWNRCGPLVENKRRCRELGLAAR